MWLCCVILRLCFPSSLLSAGKLSSASLLQAAEGTRDRREGGKLSSHFTPKIIAFVAGIFVKLVILTAQMWSQGSESSEVIQAGTGSKAARKFILGE